MSVSWPRGSCTYIRVCYLCLCSTVRAKDPLNRKINQSVFELCFQTRIRDAAQGGCCLGTVASWRVEQQVSVSLGSFQVLYRCLWSVFFSFCSYFIRFTVVVFAFVQSRALFFFCSFKNVATKVVFREQPVFYMEKILLYLLFWLKDSVSEWRGILVTFLFVPQILIISFFIFLDRLHFALNV